MHELSIAIGIIDVVEQEAARLGGHRVEAVHLRVGGLAGIVKDALVASYELASENTPLAGSRLVIEDVPIVIQCPTCDARRQVRSVQNLSCQVCGTPSAHIVEGRELQVSAVEIDV